MVVRRLTKKTEPTLTEVLASLGYTHKPREHEGQQGRSVVRDGHVVWQGTAHECWKWLRATGQIESS